MKRFHASPERSGREKLLSQKLSLESDTFLRDLINAFPYIITILNENRQIIFYNESLIRQIGLKNFNELFGKATGEVLQCVHLIQSKAGCGTTEQCRYCGAVNTILSSLRENRMITNECRIFAEQNGTQVTYDFLVSSKPFYWNKERFLIFTLTDISSEKRKRMLERIFFHDVLNTAGNLKNIAELITQVKDLKEKEDFVKIIGNLSAELVEEIEAQKQLSEAESGELVPRNSLTNSQEIINSVVMQFQNRHDRKCTIKVPEDSENINFTTDRSLVTRVIKNMVINAIEASPDSTEILLDIKRIGSNLRFEVKNPAYIPKEVQIQIFKRSFSTKGHDRGLGTYGMKLLGERYLQGKVYFTTSEMEGTAFFFELPVS